MPETRDPQAVIAAAEQAALAGDYAAAERLLRDAAGLQEASLGPDHPELANTLNNLGVVYEVTEKPDEAERCVSPCVHHRRRGPGTRSSVRRHEPEESRGLLRRTRDPGRCACPGQGRPSRNRSSGLRSSPRQRGLLHRPSSHRRRLSFHRPSSLRRPSFLNPLSKRKLSRRKRPRLPPLLNARLARS